MSRLPAEPALVGRNQEITQLTQHLNAALKGQGTTVLISGEAGVGKTRLVNEFLNQAKDLGITVLSGWCLSEAAISYFPFSEAFSNYLSATHNEHMKSNMTRQLGIIGWLKGPQSTKRIQESEPFLTPKTARDKTFEDVVNILLQLVAQEPLIIFLDDLHWADHLSLALLHYIARKCRNSQLLIIGTFRPEELFLREEKSVHPLEETIFAMSREDLLTKIELPRLKQNDFPTLLQSIFHSTIDTKFMEKLFHETEGNPLFTLETLTLLVNEGILSEQEGEWTLTTSIETMGIPSKIHDVITRRIMRLGSDERQLLDLAAVYGSTFNPDILSQIVTSDIRKVLHTLVNLEQGHQLIRSEDSTYVFTHHQIREIIYANLPSPLRQVYHLKTAQCLEHVKTDSLSNIDMASIAKHYVEGDASERAFPYLVKLGEEAVDLFANLQAIEYLTTALDATKKVPSLATPEYLSRIHLLRGRAWMGQGAIPKAIDDFNIVYQHAPSISTESLMTETHYWMGSAQYWSGNWDDAQTHLKKARELARKTGNRLLESRSSFPLAYMLACDLDTFDEGIQLFKESFRICREIGDTVSNTQNRVQLGMVYVHTGDFDLAKEHLDEALTQTTEMGDTLWQIACLFALTMLQGSTGEYNRAISSAQKGLQLSQEYDITYFIAPILTTLGWIYHDLSNINLALQHHHKALQQKTVVCKKTLAFLVDLGMDYVSKKNYETAAKYLIEADKMISPQRGKFWRFKTRVLLSNGEISLAKGDYSQALRVADEALFMAEEAGAKKYIAKSLKLKAETLARMNKQEAALALMDNALRKAQQIGNPPLIWQIHHSLGRLLEESGHLQRASKQYEKAISLIESTASALEDPSLTHSLLTATETKMIKDSYLRLTN